MAHALELDEKCLRTQPERLAHQDNVLTSVRALVALQRSAGQAE